MVPKTKPQKPIIILILLFVFMAPLFEATGYKTELITILNHPTSTTKYNHLSMQSILNKKPRVAIFLHEGIEILDLAAPLEIFTIAGMEVFTVGVNNQPVTSQGVLSMVPTYSIENAPKADIIVFMGGNGIKASENPKTINWIKNRVPDTEQFVSICTGVFFLAKSDILDGKTVTTFHNAVSQLRKQTTNTTVLDNVRFVDDGNVISTAGVSAGIDGSLYVVEKWMGKDVVQQVLEYMEYQCWDRDSGLIIQP